MLFSGYHAPPNNIDGVNQWESISKGQPSKRQGLVIDINQAKDMYAIVWNNYKYIKGKYLETIFLFY